MKCQQTLKKGDVLKKDNTFSLSLQREFLKEKGTDF